MVYHYDLLEVGDGSPDRLMQRWHEIISGMRVGGSVRVRTQQQGLAIHILGFIFQWRKYFHATGAQQINSFQDLRYYLDGVNSTLCQLHKIMLT
jgi:hypothetical protein